MRSKTPVTSSTSPAAPPRGSANAPLHWDGDWTARNRLNECKTYGGGVSQDMLMSDPRVATIGNYYSATSHANTPQLAERTRHPACSFP